MYSGTEREGPPMTPCVAQVCHCVMFDGASDPAALCACECGMSVRCIHALYLLYVCCTGEGCTAGSHRPALRQRIDQLL